MRRLIRVKHNLKKGSLGAPVSAQGLIRACPLSPKGGWESGPSVGSDPVGLRSPWLRGIPCLPEGGLRVRQGRGHPQGRNTVKQPPLGGLTPSLPGPIL
jgi:hypothetical protein